MSTTDETETTTETDLDDVSYQSWKITQLNTESKTMSKTEPDTDDSATTTERFGGERR
jgi:hypothetical protein